MSYLSRYQQLITRIDNAIPLPTIEKILLPKIAVTEEIKDNFGFVILADGSAGPFYTSLGDTRQWIEQPVHQPIGKSPADIARQLDGQDIPRSALALGAFNALSQHLMRCAGFDPAAVEKRADNEPLEAHIGMVGFFRPLIERYLAQGKKVTIIEHQPERVPTALGLDVFTTPEPLADCDYILCTASTLINNSIESIVRAAGDPAKINLIGPSASGLPDLLFELDIHSTGGLIIDRPEDLEEAIAAGDAWSSCGRKYQLTREDYPGVTRLLEAIIHSSMN